MSVIPRSTTSWGEALGVIILGLFVLGICATFAGAFLVLLWWVWPPIPVALVCYLLDTWLFKRKKKEPC